MIQTMPAPPEVTPRWVPALLSFAAGYVDSYTFLGLFGLFVAQVTGSFITAGAQFIIPAAKANIVPDKETAQAVEKYRANVNTYINGYANRWRNEAEPSKKPE